jgi:hypothetical protein
VESGKIADQVEETETTGVNETEVSLVESAEELPEEISNPAETAADVESNFSSIQTDTSSKMDDKAVDAVIESTGEIPIAIEEPAETSADMESVEVKDEVEKPEVSGINEAGISDMESISSVPVTGM